MKGVVLWVNSEKVYVVLTAARPYALKQNIMFQYYVFMHIQNEIEVYVWKIGRFEKIVIHPFFLLQINPLLEEKETTII